jgi:hypothetical protein
MQSPQPILIVDRFPPLLNALYHPLREFPVPTTAVIRARSTCSRRSHPSPVVVV